MAGEKGVGGSSDGMGAGDDGAQKKSFANWTTKPVASCT